MDAQSNDGVTSKPRTRTNVRQSKYGCFTCKARRVKCDEAKPSCRRCRDAGRKCHGYPLGAPRDPKNSSKAGTAIAPDELSWSISPHINTRGDLEQERLRALGCAVLAAGSMGAKTILELDFWTGLVPRMANSVDIVKEAAAAFGASYEHQVLKSRSSSSKLALLTRTAVAVKKLQEGLTSLSYEPLPVLVTCILLSCAETLQHRNTTALHHVRGAFAAMALHGLPTKHSLGSKSLESYQAYQVCQKLEVQVAAYALLIVPELPFLARQTLPDLKNITFSLDAADYYLTHALRACYQFTSHAHNYKYSLSAGHRHLLLIEQGRHIANLESWLCWYERNNKDQEVGTSSIHGWMLQVQCLGSLVSVSNILSPYEASYDRHSSEFQRIVQYAEQVLNATRGYERLVPFSLEGGIIQPLFLTAVKYRDSSWRSKAISLLQRCGREGPWCNYVHATSAAAVVRAEEAAAFATVPEARQISEMGHSLVPEEVGENCRVASNIIHDIVESSNGSKKLIVQLSKCRDIEALLACSSDMSLKGKMRHWLVWNEIYDISMY